MNTFAIDTSSDYLSLALAHNHRVLGHYYVKTGRKTNQVIISVIDDLLCNVDLSPKQLHRLVVVLGPGSFTGTRIGLAVAKSFAQVLRIPLLGVDSLQLLAAQTLPQEGTPFYAALNCVRDDIYFKPLQWQEGRLETMGPIQLTRLETFREVAQDTPVVFQRFDSLHTLSDEVVHSFTTMPLRAPFPDGTILLEEGLRTFAHLSEEAFPKVDPIYIKPETRSLWKH